MKRGPGEGTANSVLVTERTDPVPGERKSGGSPGTEELNQKEQ